MSKYVVLKLYLLNVVLTLHTTKKYWRSAENRRRKFRFRRNVAKAN